MKFDKNKTCLEFLENGINCEFLLGKRDWPVARRMLMKQDIKDAMIAHKDSFSERVQFITQPFYSAFKDAQTKITDILKEEPLGTISGTFLVNAGSGVVKTIFYAIANPEPKNFSAQYIEFSRSKHDDITFCASAIQIIDNGDVNYYIADDYEKQHIDHFLLIAEFVLMCGFLKYCDIETKIIKPQEKYKDTYNIKYFNETKSNIEILDSRWFTEIVRSEGFKVRGHFRLQPYGQGMVKKKWIYINSFDKTGYTSPAKKHE